MSTADPSVPSTIPSACCAIPFTSNGSVYYGCADDGGGVGCFHDNRDLKLCEQPAGIKLKKNNNLDAY